MIIQTGEPPCDGRYFVWAAIPNSEYAEPKVVDRLRGSWLWERRVLGWVGPIELRTVESFGVAREYDL